jgi:hypothetical protein
VLAVVLAAVAGVMGHGVATVVPPGWHLVSQPVGESTCDPVQRLALATYRLPLTGRSIAAVPRNQAVVIVLEDHVNPPSNYHRKLRHIRLAWQRPTQFEGCCGLPTAPGWQVSFRSRGRDLVVQVHAGPSLRPRLRAQILRIVTSIHG